MIAERIKQEVLSWQNVSEHPHRFGGVEFRIGNREIGHLHGDRMADLPFPTRVRNELVAAGKAQPHHLLKDSGWVSYYIRGLDDVPNVIDLFRTNYEIAIRQKRPRKTE